MGGHCTIQAGRGVCGRKRSEASGVRDYSSGCVVCDEARRGHDKLQIVGL